MIIDDFEWVEIKPALDFLHNLVAQIQLEIVAIGSSIIN